jgi:CMP-N-acetylneuraminic acid synthetase
VPFLNSQHLKEGHNLLKTGTAKFVFPIVQYSPPIQRALKLDKHDNLFPFNPEFVTTRTQDLEPTYHDAGQFYWGKSQVWKNTTRIHTFARGLKIPSSLFVDIDTIEDWQIAEEIFKSILRMDGRMRVIGTMAAASVLPKAKLFKAGLSGHDYSEN